MTANSERERWEWMPEVGAGPLRFGMSPTDVAVALQVVAPQEKVGGPYGQENFADGVKVFYDEGRLACVSLDAVVGPQAFLAGWALAGRDPEQAHQFLLDHAEEHGNCLLYTSDESLALTDLGLLLRAQRVGDVLLSRPLFVIEEWFDSEYYRDRLPLEGAPVVHARGEPS
ncbi:hypothetical protein P8A22_25870 [Streptomyces laculatispora]|uniref:Uncharacterized protein n=1 Tax=Streptomyces laculatispora TaxID=887464 RepID=A0ABY9I882_9ACTN|nr:hypothetical protein [Streptomyces laculatispora]WLQ43055.1 hypothetical protein P8A22_25870 [Streptomyces laculatispora]